MRILFTQYTSEWTGPSKSLWLLAERLREEHELHAVLPGQGPLAERLESLGVQVVTYPTLTKRQLLRLARHVRREGIDLVYANDANSTSRIAAVAARLGGARYLCHVRSMGWGKSWLRLGYLWSADAVIAVSKACADSVRRFVRPDRLHVVYNGVSDLELAPATPADRAYLREELGVPRGSVMVTSVAHVCERKGQLHAIEAAERLMPNRPDLHLCLAGSQDREPHYVERLRSHVRQRGLEGRVHLVGFREDATRLMRGSDVFLHTAGADPHPRAVVEAMAAGLPVVAFDVDGVSETVVDGETGRLVPQGNDTRLAEALEGMLGEPARAARMGEAGRRRVESTFTEARTSNGVRSVLARLAAEDGARPGAAQAEEALRR